MVFVRFSAIFMVALILNLSPSCSTFLHATSVRVCGFAFDFCRRCSLPTFREYRRTMAFPNHVQVFRRLLLTSPYAIGDNMDAFCGISLRFWRGVTTFLLVVNFPCPLAHFPFAVVPFLRLGVLLPTTDVAAL